MSVLWQAVASRLDLLGIELGPLALLGIDLLLLLILAGCVTRYYEQERSRPGRQVLIAGLVVLTTVVASSTVLGAFELLTNRNLILAHVILVTLATAAAKRRGESAVLRHIAMAALVPVRAALTPLRDIMKVRGWMRDRRAETLLLLAILVVLVFFGVLAVFTLPLNFDSNTYRLSRIAYWLQEGSIYHFPTNDIRQNWVGQNADLVMLWLVSFFQRDYPLVQLVQYCGGLLACAAISELGAALGLNRFWRLASVLTLLGIPTASTQFFTSQTDLFTAGCLTASLAFLPAALRERRGMDWIFIGIGFGLAIGAKATVLYCIPGATLLVACWARLERTSARAFFGGSLIAVAVALPLCGFNFLLNLRDYRSPVAPAQALSWVASSPEQLSASRASWNALGLVWQLFEPHSNPFVPSILREPVSELLLDRLAARRSYFRDLRESLSSEKRGLPRGLGEDEASFGLPIAIVALLGGLSALFRLRRGGDVRAIRTAAIYAIVVSFLAIVSWLPTQTVNQYRYLCLIAPSVALLGAELLSHARRRITRAIGAFFLILQFATAIDVGVEARNEGVRALRDPTSAFWYPRWAEARELVASLGERPLNVGLCLFGNSWQAPYFRSQVPHRWHPITVGQITDQPAIRRLLETHRLDALVADPAVLRERDLTGLAVRFADNRQTTRRATFLPLPNGERDQPRVLEVEGVDEDGWSRPVARFRLMNWTSSRFELRAENPTPLRREVELRSGISAVRLVLEPRSAAMLAVGVRARDLAILRVDPVYVPGAFGASGDPRELGLLLRARVANSKGLFADRWTAPRARLDLVNWITGVFVREFANPTPLARSLHLRSSLESIERELAPNSSMKIELAVMPQDSVEIEVAPPFVPSAWGHAGDDRQLGLLFDRGDSAPPEARLPR